MTKIKRDNGPISNIYDCILEIKKQQCLENCSMHHRNLYMQCALLCECGPNGLGIPSDWSDFKFGLVMGGG